MMKCKCSADLLPLEDICFYAKHSKSVDLMIRYEKANSLECKFDLIPDKPNYFKILCVKCHQSVGKKHPHGPNSSNIMAFGNDKVMLLERKLGSSKMNAWYNVYKDPPFNEVLVRNSDNFFGIDKSTNTPDANPNNQQNSVTCPIVWPDCQNESDFYLDDVIMSDVIPRDYQITAYLEALQRDLILVLPTGCGKTLVASMVAAKMKMLNPNHMILFLVDRIPLVFQQGESISIATHLNVCSLTSELNTDLKRRKLNQGVYDVLVTTAGSFLSLLSCLNINQFCYVVFDECHHATKEHEYKVVLEKIKTCDPNNRPRVLGLTASPPSTKGQLEDFRRSFFDAPICHDLSLTHYKYATPSIEKCIVRSEPDWHLTNYLQILENELYKLADSINEPHSGTNSINEPHSGTNSINEPHSGTNSINALHSGTDSINEPHSGTNSINALHSGTDSINEPHSEMIGKSNWQDKNKRDQLCTKLDSLQDDDKIKKDIESMKNICRVMTITELLGVTYANNTLEGMDVYSRLKNDDIFSPRLEGLFQELDKLDSSSKIIIFVRTRQIAHILTDILKRNDSINKKFSPLKIVGQYGLFGMSWINEQEEILQNFRDGCCNLLVSTSVLEEGLDIPYCDVVIRFDKIDSLISYKQSKGRARKPDKCKFILIISEKDEQHLTKIQEHEQQVKQLLTDHFTDAAVPSEFTKKIEIQIIKDIAISATPSNASELIFVSECAVEFYLEGIFELFDIGDEIANFLRDDHHLMLNLIDQARDKSNWKSKSIFPPEDSLFILGLHTQSRNVYQRYFQLSMDWDYTFMKNNVWTKVQVPTSKSLDIKSVWPITKISLGSFIDRKRYQLSEVFGKNEDESIDIIGQFELVLKENIEIKLTSIKLFIEIPFTSIHRFVLTHWKDSDVTLYLPLSYCPTIRTHYRGPRLSCNECDYLKSFGDYPVLSVTLKYDKSEWSDIWIFLHSSVFPIPVFDTQVSISKHTPIIQEQNYSQISDKRVQDCVWMFYVLKSNRDICLPDQTIHDIYSEVSNQINESDCSHINALKLTIENLVSRISRGKTYYFFDLINSFQKDFTNRKELKHDANLPDIQKNYRFIECAMLTPATIIPLPPVYTQCSRLYRKYPDERFLNLAFREEHGEALNCTEEFRNRIESCLITGVEINGIRFHFLLCSGSQMRSKRAIFIHVNAADSQEAIRSIRSELIGDSKISNTTKYLSRLGLFCTSDHPICEIDRDTTHQIDDLLAENRVKLTDGNGKINMSIAEQVFQNANVKQNASIDNTTAIQVRLAGLKGVLTIVDPKEDADFREKRQGTTIIYRESMKKINWTDSMLCLVKVGKYSHLYFNTQMLTLLASLEDSSTMWDPKPRLRQLYRNTLQEYAGFLHKGDSANKKLKSSYPNYRKETSEHFDILSEPFFLSLLRCIYTFKIRLMLRKFHFLAEDACLLMGIPDPIGVLKDGEVFITYIDEDGKHQIKEGRILVYKNPCLHPGDLLVPTAVDKDELHHLHNVIVFPIIGKISLPACSGGGDLDGDEFGIIWDEELVPPEGATFAPLNYDKVLAEYKEKLQQDEPESEDENLELPLHNDPNISKILAGAYFKIVSNDLLGIISHYHVAVSDMRENGARDELAIELARLASLAVDSPKTGITPIVPKEIQNLIKDKGYPDFMEKIASTSYPSTKLLGELYQMAKSTCYEVSEWANVLNFYDKHDFKHKIPANIPIQIFQIPGHEEFMEEAKSIYFEYATALQRLMLAFGINTEAELVLGMIIRCHPLLSADHGKTTNALQAAVEDLSQEYRYIFRKGMDEDQLYQKAAAWYLTVYECLQSQDNIFLSFPWLVGEYLCKIVKSSKVNVKTDMPTSIGKSAREYLTDKKGTIENIVGSKINLVQSIDLAINQHARTMFASASTDDAERIFNVQAFGSVSKYHCQPESDLDISVSLTEYGHTLIPNSRHNTPNELTKIRKNILETYISPSLGNIADSKSNKFNLEVPIISIQMDSPMKSCPQVSVDLTVESDGVDKANHILQLYSTTKGVFFSLLWILIHWARHVGILKCHSSPDSTGMILTAEFEALVLYIYEQMDNKPQTIVGDEIDCSLDSMFHSLTSADLDKTLGFVLEEFFHFGYKITRDKSEIKYTWPIKGEPFHTIHPVALSKISGLLFQGWHCLAFTRDISKLLQRVEINLKFVKRFSTFLSDMIRSSTQYYEKDLTNKTGCIVKIEQMGRNILLTAQGSASSIHELSSEVTRIESNSALTKRYKSNASRYMIDGNLVLVIANNSLDSKVKLKDFTHGCCKHFHYYNKKSILVSTDKSINNNWKEEGTVKLKNRLCAQLKDFPTKCNDFLENLKFKTRFGSFYVLEGIDAMHSVGNSLDVEEFESCLVKGKSNRFGDNSTVEEKSAIPSNLQLNKDNKSIRDKPPQNQKPKDHKTKNKDKVYSLSSGFCPGIYNIKTPERMEMSKQVFRTSLQECKFTRLDEGKKYTWRVELEMAVNYDIRVNLDSTFRVVGIYTRPYIWLMATILSDRNTVDERIAHDLRLRAESTKVIGKDTDLYKVVLPDGLVSSVLNTNENGKVEPCDRLKDKVKIIKHNKEVEYYKLENVVAKMCSGTEYCRENFDNERQFCELTLYHSEDELIRSVASGSDSSCRIQSIATSAVDISLKLSEVIQNNMPEFNT
ncbi:RNA-dependent RNA polymerase 1-like [Oopsacas minuta]|uniref:RNA-directed RNA polymerase n=1 Tax=Oopsacas minuta TaxID=111878 RepID=A0AAV7JL02_9METZ|nr:RNA-dependent RNA polymerase 1-like [Oopsacas minuta]